MRLRRFIAASVAGAAGCSLVVDTTGYTGGASPSDAGSEAAVLTGDGSTDAAADPCADPSLLFCESFGSSAALARFSSSTDPSTSVAVSTEQAVSGPSSARFEIRPDTNTSPDATLHFGLSQSLARYTFETWLRIDREQAGQVGRLLALNLGGGDLLLLERSGKLLVAGGAQLGSIAPPPLGEWLAVRIVIRADATPTTVSVDVGKAHADVTIPSGWSAGGLDVTFGISEASSPTTGWLVYWDDLRVKSP